MVSIKKCNVRCFVIKPNDGVKCGHAFILMGQCSMQGGVGACYFF